MIIREANMSDAEQLLEIYSYYVVNTAITFEYDPPSAKEFRSRVEKITAGYPYLVAEENGRIIGYAYASPFHVRAAYGWSSEVTIYLDHMEKGRGVGRMLYEHLEAAVKKMGILNLYACIGYPEVEDEYLTRNSADFHRHLGFEEIGRFHKCGYKFGRWYDMIWMEKIIGEHTAGIEPVKRIKRTGNISENEGLQELLEKEA